ncbi:MAG: 50S ribosomal protein L15 [Candidatus Brocadiae bacterium]|nr:50S ribosomal protein L15 [Candidatus Brocadiia bacterium]
MNLFEIKTAPIPKKVSKRVGRGSGSGKGTSCGRGLRGQKKRQGNTDLVVFEGGIMPLFRRLPKRGFQHDRFDDLWVTVNVEDLNCFQDGEEVNLESVTQKGIVKFAKSKKTARLKILGKGELTVQNLKIKAYKVSEKAKEQLEKAKATLEILKIMKKVKKSRRRKSS